MKHEINSQSTKQMLADTLVSLLHKKSISKIKVSEIVELCDINRKTFYYHFTDVYDLLEWYLDGEIQKAVEQLDPFHDYEATIDYSMQFFQDTKYLYNCIDNPLGRDKVINFLNKQLQPKIKEFFEQTQAQYQETIDSAFREFLVNSMTNVIVLSIIDSIEHPDKYELEQLRLYLTRILHATIKGFYSNV